MTYQQARRIRNKDYSLTNLITRNIRSKDMGAGQAIKAALREKFDVRTRLKAKVTGIKEKFDILNIAKFLTGGSNVAPALLGKLLGRSKADIRNFTGGRQSYEDFGSPTATKVGKDPRAGGDMTGMSDVLQKILELQKRTYENIKEQRETKNNFQEERDIESKKRHDELLKAIKGFEPGSKSTAEKMKDNGGFSLADLLGDASLAGRLLSVLKWFGGPVGVALLGATSMVALILLIAAGLKKLADNTENMKALSPNEAQAVLQNGSERDIEAAGGREKLENIIKNGRQNAIDALNMSENTEEEKEIKRQKILELGGKDKLEQIIKDEKVYDIPTAKPSGENKPDNVIPKAEYVKNSRKTKDAAAKIWEQTYGKDYNDDGTKKLAEPAKTENVTPPTTTAPAASTAEPAATTPPSQQLNAATNENRTAKMTSMVTPPTPTVNNVQTNTTQKTKRPKEPILPVRNMEETFQRMIYNSTRIV